MVEPAFRLALPYMCGCRGAVDMTLFHALSELEGARAGRVGLAPGVAWRKAKKALYLQRTQSVSRTSRARGYEPRPQDATPRSAFQDRL